MPHFVLPGPPRVFEALRLIAANGDLWHNLAITLGRVVAGFILATVIGLPLGILLGAVRRVGEFFEPVIPIMNTVSSAIWAIFAIIWFGISNATTIFVVFMTAMPLIVTNVWQGTRTVNADFIELAHILRMPQYKVMTKIYLPTILPYFFSGARLAFGFGWRVSLVAETIGSSSGVGYRLRQAADLIQTDQVFAWTLALVVMKADDALAYANQWEGAYMASFEPSDIASLKRLHQIAKAAGVVKNDPPDSAFATEPWERAKKIK